MLEAIQGRIFDLVILNNIILGRMRSIDLADAIKASYHETKIILLSGHIGPYLAIATPKVDLILEKPVALNDLLRSIVALLGGGFRDRL